ncbi:unnamed protein product [Meloidogyne enterolobii]|uniref:Uncharacterized protein n=1 Tax=Meloidogyne enterolobii TaxID=390850 RepID=A0ACB0XYN4_MELEN
MYILSKSPYFFHKIIFSHYFTIPCINHQLFCYSHLIFIWLGFLCCAVNIVHLCLLENKTNI